MKLFQNPPISRVVELLEASGLPTSDLSEGSLEHFFACGDADNLEAVIGLEILESDGLLRSLAVSERLRGKGYGRTLVGKLEEFAKKNGVRRLYLLTEAAEKYFERYGYTKIEREVVSERIKQTKEYSGLCPDDAVVMRKVF